MGGLEILAQVTTGEAVGFGGACLGVGAALMKLLSVIGKRRLHAEIDLGGIGNGNGNGNGDGKYVTEKFCGVVHAGLDKQLAMIVASQTRIEEAVTKIHDRLDA